MSAVDPLFLSFQLALAGRYSIDREIGRGGMGVVYLAKEVHLDRSVAIKLLPPDRATNAALRDRFLREARLAAKLSHPNIIPIHSVDEVGEFVFYVMAYVDGETLADRVTHRGPMAASEGSRVLREVAWALAHAHEHGLVHRDVKPDNILLERGTGRVLVTDFGIAAAMRDSAAEGVSGTPEFMSPEQALGKEVDGRSDIYSLGATAYYAFSGRLPFEGSSPTEIIAKHVTAQPVPIGTLGITVPRKVALLIDRCLAKDPDRRPENATRMAEQLTAALEQRRELPVALRAFVKINGRLDGSGTLIFPFVALGTAVGVSVLFGLGPVVATASFVAAVVAAPGVALMFAARRLLKLGFSHSDLEPAFRAELESSKEERSFEHGKDATTGERLLRAGAHLSTAGIVVCAIGAFFDYGARGSDSSALIAGAFAFATFHLVFKVLAAQQRRDVDTEFWAKVWTGRLGRALFSAAKRITPARLLTTATTHRPTELSLSLAVDALYESLPRETRDGIGDVPSMVHALERDAHLMRISLNELQEALSSINEVRDSREYAAVRTDRDRVQEKLKSVVGAMETIRLNLLRLHAGSATVESFTTDLGSAAEINLEVERLLQAQREIDGDGRLTPRRQIPTPV